MKVEIPFVASLSNHELQKEYHHRYLYAGDNIVAIYDHDTEELLATLLHDETIDTPLSISVHPKSPLNPQELERYESLDESEQYLFNQSRIQTYYYHRDHQNSIIALSDQNAQIVEYYEYDTYGNITKADLLHDDEGKAIQTLNPYRYTGREIDTDDLYYYRARYYDPTMGRFITPDPIGFLGGDTNFYRYVGNDPMNYTDPSGLSGLTALLDQHNPLKDLVEWWNATPDTSIPTTSIPNSTILQGKTNTQTNKTQTATSKNATVGGASNSTGAKVKGNVEQKVDEKCKDQKWHDPIDNPQLAMYMQSGGIAPYWNVFGKVRNGGKHQGVDLLALPGTPVYACVDGTIKIGDMQPRPPKKVNYGKYVLIKAQCPSFVQTLKKAYSLPYKDKGEMEKEMSFKDDGDFYFFYAHLLEVDEKLKKAFEQGDVVRVKAGQIIGKTGTSGYTTSADPHLHFEITSKPFLNRVNPGFYLNYKLPRDLTQEESNRQKTIAKKRHGDPSTQK
ncbi:RHS repeat-associated core domain-containing protein [Sulfuricurvum sp.]|uniref:RHS repeat-associated core domain-containing protein n=1 Tax=Sulfuricurvum sp. TaxID=2025608 RepID=UPI002617EF2B|nr:RHS repeat-associated core domain-containing protein [Sulfuricurvum sp.]MDD3596769.1 peptidoglycan DD-metalloendopeptidase family protein [Sulfuricurvum sp.]